MVVNYSHKNGVCCQFFPEIKESIQGRIQVKKSNSQFYEFLTNFSKLDKK